MNGVQNFIKVPKADRLNILGLGMRYASFVNWAGFEIPGFPQNVHSTPSLIESVVEDFVRPSRSTDNDLAEALSLSFQDSIEDTVSLLYGSIDFAMLAQVQKRIKFETIARHFHEKYRGMFKFFPEVMFSTMENRDLVLEKMPAVFEMNFFKSVSCYAKKKVEYWPYKNLYKQALSLGLNRRALVNENYTPKEIIEVIEALSLNELMGCAHLANDKDALKYLAANGIVVNLSPSRDIFYKVFPSYAEFPLRIFLDAGVKVTIGTCALLVYQKTISEQCAALCASGVLSENEMKEFLAQSISY